MRITNLMIVASLAISIITPFGSSLAIAQGYGNSVQGYAPNASLPRTYPSGNTHRLFSGDDPPGVVGAARLQRWGSVAGHFQAVSFRGPGTSQFSLPIDGVFQPPSDKPVYAGLLIGAVYRFKITSIPGYEGEELYPTVEIIDRTYPPESMAARFPIPINLDLDDLEDAMLGRLVTRVVYLEDPSSAVPLAETPESSRALDIPGSQDPLAVADVLGKPVAIVRLGSVAPPTAEALMPQFFLGYPPWMSVIVPESITYADPAAPNGSHVTDVPSDVSVETATVGDVPSVIP
jgi:hypothetical protein